MTMMIMMIIITFCALNILILEFLTCKWQLVWSMLIKFHLLLLLLLLFLLSTHNVCLESLGPRSNYDPGALGDSQF